MNFSYLATQRFFLLFVTIAAAALFGSACTDTVFIQSSGDDDGVGGSSGTASGGSGAGAPLTSERVDLLLVIDNSRSMRVKQQLLSLAVDELVVLMTNPRCVDAAGVPTPNQPQSPTQPCMAGTREFQPLQDIHIGVISTSLGGHGADSCSGSSDPSENDAGKLLDRSSTDNGAMPVETWNNAGFLVWDPASPPNHMPPGTSDLNTLRQNVSALITGAGERGCGYESTLEAWYRFLIEPDPHESIELANNSAVLIGTDQVLLQQRRDFLRPDSVLSILMLSDENDCSIRDGGQFYFAGQIYQPNSVQPFHLPKPRAACATDPYDTCCRSCGQPPAAGCDDSNDNCSGALPALDDHFNMRCFDQKRRFGIDFLYPIERYVIGLTAAQVPDRYGNPQPNPVFSDLDPTDDISAVRSPQMALLTAVVGVPWQDLARRGADGAPDLISGLKDGVPIGGFQSAAELLSSGGWALMAGDEATPPLDPFMRESFHPRSGNHPLTGDTIQPPSAPEGANAINGHEFSNPMQRELQFSCIHPMINPLDCSAGSTELACACSGPDNDSPICVPNPNDNNLHTLQKYGKAYPGLRQLRLLRQLGNSATVGSICPAQMADASSPTFGYRPTINALLETMRSRLEPGD